MTVVYLDRVVLLNLAVDYLLLLATARLAGLPLRRRRLGLCAALGAAYAAAVFLPGCRRQAHFHDPRRLRRPQLPEGVLLQHQHRLAADRVPQGIPGVVQGPQPLPPAL